MTPPITTPIAEAASDQRSGPAAVGEVPALPAGRVESKSIAKQPARSKVNPAAARRTPQFRRVLKASLLQLRRIPPACGTGADHGHQPSRTSTPVPQRLETPRYTPEPAGSTPAATTEPRQAAFDELTVAKHSVIGIRLDAPVSTRTARVETG